MTMVGAACENIIVGATCGDDVSTEDATGIPQVGQAARPCMTGVPHLLHLESMFRKIPPVAPLRLNPSPDECV
ncbi:MAG: hypothetical protein JO360_18385 [Acidobacteria bacterium]|nr:hypothetical protein [Acidobacteriota bacterium]